MSNKEDEISVRDLILKLKEWYQYLLSKWLTLLLAGIFGGLLGLGYAIYSKPKYNATLSFVLYSGSDVSGGLSGLASQFGLDLGGGSNDAFSGDNIITLMSSQNVIKRVLFKKVPDQNDVLINVFAKEFKMDEGWKKNERTINVFPFPDSSKKLSRVQDSLVRELHLLITNKFINISKPDKKQSFYEVNTTSKNEMIAAYFTTYLVDETAKFYIETKTSTARQNLNMLQNEADSIRRLLGNTINSSTVSLDRTFNLNPALQAARSSIQESQLDITALGGAYAEIVKNLEIAKINLQKEMPLYQVIDKPELPLKAIKVRKLYAVILGGFICAFLVMIILCFKKIFRDFTVA